MASPETPRHTEEDFARARANPLFRLGLDDPQEGMHRVAFANGDELAIHVSDDAAAIAAAKEVTRECIYSWVLERFSKTAGWVIVPIT
ncbi:MAG: hypothetical protein QOJ72_1828 [Nocardioidaceae bacterium]|jgi:hypothetical protein|nr:hypothetical protein [Nocardioidaceae bacterium]